MSFLDQITPDKRDMLISLPYRVGLWVSQSDSSGGESADSEELQALSNILDGYAQEIFGSEAVQHIISGTMDHRNDWPRWSKQTGDVVVDCRQAVDILSEVVDVKEVSAFKKHLVEIGEAVALAFREENENISFGEKLSLYIRFYVGKLKALKKGQPYKTFDQFLNISLQERRALTTLAHALDTTYI